MKEYFDKIKQAWKEIWDAEDKTDIFADLKKQPSTDKFKVDLGATPDYKEIEAPVLSEDEIDKMAKQNLETEKNQKKQAIEREIKLLEQQLLDRKKDYDDNFASRKNQLEQRFNEAKENADDDINKRGLARSSIAVNTQENLSSALNSAINDLENSHNDKIVKLNDELNNLKVKREQAINDFDISYTIKLSEEIKDIKDKLKKEQDDAIKYNNQIQQNKWKDTVDKQKQENLLYKQNMDNALQKQNLPESVTDVNKFNGNNYNIIRDRLRKIPSTKARELIKNDSFIADSLTAEDYYKLYAEFFK